MANLFQIGISGLNVAQRSLATTGHNIANANTEGYSRQRVELSTRPPQGYSNGFMGKGVQVAAVSRLADQFLIGQVRNSLSNHGQMDAYYGFARQVDNLLADPQTGVGASLQEFFNALQGVANDPSSVPARQVLLSEAQVLTVRFNDLQARLQEIGQATNQRLSSTVEEINTLAESIARLNQDIVLAKGRAAGAPPNDLLDQRDRMVERLSELVAVRTVEQDDGALNITVGNGQPLVTGARSMRLGVVPNPQDASRLEVAYLSSPAVIISNQISGGSLGGTLAVRQELVEPAYRELGRVAVGLALAVNSQHAQGVDLSGALGGDFFTAPRPQSLPAAGNAGTVDVAFNPADLGGLTTSDYRLTHDGSDFTLMRLSDGNAWTLSGAGPFEVDGLTLTVGSAPAAGDSWLIQPTRLAAREIGLAIDDPREVAAAAPIRTRTGETNFGTGSISAGVVTDVANPNLMDPVTISFNDPPTTYAINGAGSFPYTPGEGIQVNGWEVAISGVPAAGDSFRVEANTGGVGDNRNALALAGIANLRTLAAGTATLQNAYGQLVTHIGSETRQSEISLNALGALRDQAEAFRSSVSGVNLDEEAADMLRFQQAYQAAAQVIAIANSVFDSLLAAVRR